jgi:hypothetical protein
MNVEQRTRVPAFARIILAIVVLAFALVGAYVVYQQSQKPVVLYKAVLSLPTNATVVTEVQRIGKLETVTYTLQQVIVYDPNPGWFGDSKKLFVVYGKVTAGFDLSSLKSSAVNTQKKNNQITSITLNMPAPQILSTAIDPTRTKVYDANSGLVLWNSTVDPNTTIKILAEAQKTLQSDACQDGILQQASDSAQTHLTSFLTTVGFPSATINIPTATCS